MWRKPVIWIAALVVSPFGMTPAARSENSRDINFVNLLEAGSSRSVAVQGDFLYAGLGNYFLAIDVSGPADPVRTGSARVITTSSLWSVYDIALSGNHALTADDAGLHVIDVSDPYNPLEVGADESGPGLGVAVSGSVAFVTNTDGVRSVDVSDPQYPVVIGSVATSEWAMKLRVAGDHAFVAGFSGSLMVIDVGDPAAMVEAAWYDVGAYSWGLDVQDTLAYLPLEHGTSGLSIIDVGTPDAPVEIGRYAAYNPKDVVVSGPYAYLVGTPYLAEVIDVSDPTSPFRAAVLDDTGGHEIVEHGNRVYIADYGSSFRVVDVEDPLTPVVVGRYDCVSRGACVAWEGSNLFVGESGGGFASVDLTNPGDPAILASIGHTETTSDIEAMGSELFTGNNDSYTDGSFGGFSIYDTSDPLDPVHVSTAYSWGVVGDIEVDSMYLYGVGLRSPPGYQFFVYDIADRTYPAEISTLPIDGSPKQTSVAEDIACVAARSGGLVVVDISDRYNPAELAVFTGDISDVQLAGHYGFAIESGSGLVVIDLSDPANPVEVSRTNDIGTPKYVTVAYPWVITTGDNDNFLRVLDASDPMAPVVVAEYETGGTGPAAVHGNLLAMATEGPGSVLILEGTFLSDPTAAPNNTIRPLHLAQNYPNPFNPATTIRYSIAEPGRVTLQIYDVTGRLVRTLVDEAQSPEQVRPVTWDGRNDAGFPVASGVYLYRLVTHDFTRIRKMVLIK